MAITKKKIYEIASSVVNLLRLRPTYLKEISGKGNAYILPVEFSYYRGNSIEEESKEKGSTCSLFDSNCLASVRLRESASRHSDDY